MQLKVEKKVLVFEIMAFEFVAGTSFYFHENTCHGQSRC